MEPSYIGMLIALADVLLVVIAWTLIRGRTIFVPAYAPSLPPSQPETEVWDPIWVDASNYEAIEEQRRKGYTISHAGRTRVRMVKKLGQTRTSYRR